MFCFMQPPIEESVVRTAPDRWIMGSSFRCEVLAEAPDDFVTSWQSEGKAYYLRAYDAVERGVAACGDSEIDRVHHAGTSAAVWDVGHVFCKVKAWRPDMQLESETITFVNEMTSIPTPQVVYTWIDERWNRSFLLLRSVSGQTLASRWPSLAQINRERIASLVARYCANLATLTSRTLTTASGKGVMEPFLRALPPRSDPSWLPQLLGPYSATQLKSYLYPYPYIKDEEVFHFYHADLGPTNIMIADDGNVAGIIDWESAAFYPRFWLGTKPLVSAGFYLTDGDRKAWANMLAVALEKEGFSSDMERYHSWTQAIRNG